MRRVPDRNSPRSSGTCPRCCAKPLSDDRGKELAQYERLAIRVLFADSYSLWQRGTNKNTTGLLRQCLPKGSGLLGESQRGRTVIAYRLNPRPQTCLTVATPREVHAHLRPRSPLCTWNVKPP